MSIDYRLIMVPEDPGFQEILFTAPPPDITALSDDSIPYVVGIDGIPRAIKDEAALQEYLFGGEYDEMMLDAEDPCLIEEF